MMIGVFSPEKRALGVVSGLTVASFVAVLAYYVFMASGERSVAFAGLFVTDSFAIFMKVLVLLGAVLVLSAVDPSAGGACVYGRRGTCKTVLARATHALLPDHDVVPGSYANADPDAGPGEWETGLLERLADEANRLLAKGSSTSLDPPDSAAASASNVEPSSQPSSQNLRLARRLETLAPSLFRATRAPPFVTVPLSATEDMCVGTVDVEASAKSGAPRFQPGCLARAHRGVLYLDELNLMDDAILNLVLTALADGRCVVEREGVQAAHPCRTAAAAPGRSRTAATADPASSSPGWREASTC